MAISRSPPLGTEKEWLGPIDLGTMQMITGETWPNNTFGKQRRLSPLLARPISTSTVAFQAAKCSRTGRPCTSFAPPSTLTQYARASAGRAIADDADNEQASRGTASSPLLPRQRAPAPRSCTGCNPSEMVPPLCHCRCGRAPPRCELSPEASRCSRHHHRGQSRRNLSACRNEGPPGLGHARQLGGSCLALLPRRASLLVAKDDWQNVAPCRAAAVHCWHAPCHCGTMAR